jgi:hypothetical protein
MISQADHSQVVVLLLGHARLTTPECSVDARLKGVVNTIPVLRACVMRRAFESSETTNFGSIVPTRLCKRTLVVTGIRVTLSARVVNNN